MNGSLSQEFLSEKIILRVENSRVQTKLNYYFFVSNIFKEALAFFILFCQLNLQHKEGFSVNVDMNSPILSSQ